MAKRHISIIGSCVSREIFNTSLISEIFDIDSYIFQRCVWDMSGKKNAFPKEHIEKINAENFSVRMFAYSLNRNAFDDLKNKNSEFLLIDLHNLSSKVIKAVINSNSYYFQSTTSADKNILQSINSLGLFDNVKFETLECVSDDIIKNGLDLFAQKILQIYNPENVILYSSRSAKKYYKDGQIKPYSDFKQNFDNYNDSIVEKWTRYLSNMIPGSKILEDVGDKIAVFGVHDDVMALPYPPSEHYCETDQIRQALALLNLLGISVDVDMSEILFGEFLKLKDSLSKTTFELASRKKYFVTLNNYFSRIESLEDVIIVIASKDDASKNMKYFRNKASVPFSFRFRFRDSYVAVLDKSREFIYEEASQEKIRFEYVVDGKKLAIESAGYNDGNYSKITINDGENLSKNTRGLNILILDSSTLDIIDIASCDTFGDKDLVVDSEYFKNVKLTK